MLSYTGREENASCRAAGMVEPGPMGTVRVEQLGQMSDSKIEKEAEMKTQQPSATLLSINLVIKYPSAHASSIRHMLSHCLPSVADPNYHKTLHKVPLALP